MCCPNSQRREVHETQVVTTTTTVPMDPNLSPEVNTQMLQTQPVPQQNQFAPQGQVIYVQQPVEQVMLVQQQQQPMQQVMQPVMQQSYGSGHVQTAMGAAPVYASAPPLDDAGVEQVEGANVTHY